MKIAQYHHHIIDLAGLPREDYQQIYEEGLAGNLTCPSCQQELKLYLGIRKAPHFLHKGLKETPEACVAHTAQYTQKKAENDSSVRIDTAELNGFRLPKSRPITDQASTRANYAEWRTFKAIEDLPPFQRNGKPHNQPDSAYYQMLQEHGVFLDRSQWRAVSKTEGPLLIFAGAGSGKTRVLTARTAYMIHEKQIDPRGIMLVTFTTKAAREIKERLATYPGMTQRELRSLLTGTFHSIFYRIVTHHEPDKWQSSSLLKWEWQRERIIKEAGRELELDEKEFAWDQALQKISYWKNTLVMPESVQPADQWEERTAYLYKRYEETKREQGTFDFDDMLIGCHRLFLERPDILERYQNRFSHFLIDEFQDINKVQYEIMKLLSANTNNLCVVGDDDQSIYAFRGSDPSFILNFTSDFPGATTVTLDQNYRSAHSIVATANKVIKANQNRKPKKMEAQYEHDLHPIIFFPYDEEEEATMIVTDIKERIEQGASAGDFAILYRTHSASRAMFERLSQSNLPFVVENDATSFYERRMVKSMLAYMRLSLHPDDTKAMTDLLVSQFLKQSVLQDLKAASILNDCSLVEALTTVKNIQSFQQRKLKKIIPMFKRLKHMTPLDAIDTIEKDMGFNDFIKNRGNEGNVIEKGSDDIRDLRVVAKKFKTIPELLAHADHMTAMTEEMKKLGKQYKDAIQLTTIHRSKGLEYEHVYIIGMVEGGIPHDYALDALRNGDTEPLEEERRLAYVAMTRAKETLSISAPDKRRHKTASTSRFLRQFIHTKAPV